MAGASTAANVRRAGAHRQRTWECALHARMYARAASGARSAARSGSSSEAREQRRPLACPACHCHNSAEQRSTSCPQISCGRRLPQTALTLGRTGMTRSSTPSRCYSHTPSPQQRSAVTSSTDHSSAALCLVLSSPVILHSKAHSSPSTAVGGSRPVLLLRPVSTGTTRDLPWP